MNEMNLDESRISDAPRARVVRRDAHRRAHRRLNHLKRRIG
jgi:hypothetical protein